MCEIIQSDLTRTTCVSLRQVNHLTTFWKETHKRHYCTRLREKDKDFLCNRSQLGVSENVVVKKKPFDICNRSKSYIELFVLCRFSIDSWFSGWHSCKAGQSKYDWHQNWMICSHYKKKSWTNMFEWRKDYVWFYKIHFGYSNRSIICHKL